MYMEELVKSCDFRKISKVCDYFKIDKKINEYYEANGDILDDFKDIVEKCASDEGIVDIKMLKDKFKKVIEYCELNNKGVKARNKVVDVEINM